ncbi:MAG: hypothetical protein WKG07_33550 [Hymenobacter sp.]
MKTKVDEDSDKVKVKTKGTDGAEVQDDHQKRRAGRAKPRTPAARKPK